MRALLLCLVLLACAPAHAQDAPASVPPCIHMVGFAPNDGSLQVFVGIPCGNQRGNMYGFEIPAGSPFIVFLDSAHVPKVRYQKPVILRQKGTE